MAQNKMELLRQLETQLLEELAKVRELMGSNESQAPVAASTNTVTKSQRREKVVHRGIGTPKGAYSWDEYVPIILVELGGRGKLQDALEYARKANPRIDHNTLYNALRGTLSKLYRSGAIGATKGKNKKEGYEFHLLKPAA